jgi:CubicO group peptidase (beta-lactamase class C family)
VSIPLRLLAFLALLPRGAAAQAVEVTVDAKALEATVDRYVAAYLQAAPLPGVAFAFVAGDQVVLAKGYGSAAEPVRRRLPCARSSNASARVVQPR